MTRLRVLHVTGVYPPATEWGGTATAAAAMAEACADVADVTVFTTSQRATRALPRERGERHANGVRVVTFGSVHAGGRAFLSPGLIAALPEAVRRHDVVHIHLMWNAPEIAAARICQRARVPYVLSPHGCLDPWSLAQRKREKQLLLLATERRNLRQAAFIHFTADRERSVAPGWARALPSVVIPNVIDAAAFSTPARGSRVTHDILVLGRVHLMKGFDTLIPAMRRILDHEPRARLVIAGPDEGGYRREVERMIQLHRLEFVVEFTGHVNPAERRALLARAALLVAPSYRENFGMSVAEAMAAELPVVVSDGVNIADDIRDAGAGLVVPKDPDALATAVLAILEAPAQRRIMGRAGRALVARFSPGVVGARLLDAYRRAAMTRCPR